MTSDRPTPAVRWLLTSIGEAVLLATAAGVIAGLLTLKMPGLWTAAIGATTASVTFGVLLYRAGRPDAQESSYPASASAPGMQETSE